MHLLKKDAQPHRDKELHAGHRGRLRKKFLLHGVDALAEHEMLELLLYAAIPRRNVNELAHRLLNEFGGLAALLAAPIESIKNVEGAGEHVAVTIKLIPSMYRYADSKRDEILMCPNPDEWFNILKKRFVGARREYVYMLCLDSSHRFLSIKEVGGGSMKSAPLRVRDVIEEALRTDACYVVLAHNHLSGKLEPSQQDKAATSVVNQALMGIETKLLDHFIIAGDKYRSILNANGYSSDF